MAWWLHALWVTAALGVTSLAYAVYRLARPPTYRPSRFRRDERPVLACLGSSTVHGHAGWDWVGALRSRLPQWAFMNGGLNGDLAENVLRRLDPVIAHQPDAVVILIGANDAMGAADAGLGRGYQKSKRLSEPPSLAFFERSLRQTVERLKRETPARIGLMTLVRIGGDRSAAVDQLALHNATIARLAQELEVELIPLADRYHDFSGPAWEPGGRMVWRVISACWWRYVLGMSWDRIADRRGSWLHADTIHLSERAGRVVADAVQEWLAASD